MAVSECALYQQRRLQATPLYRLVDAHDADVRGGWDRAGQWVPVPFVDGEAEALLLRH